MEIDTPEDPQPESKPDDASPTITSDPAPSSEDAAATVKEAETDPKPIPYKEAPVSEDFEYVLSRVALHPKLIQTIITLHTTSGIKRFRAAAQFILDGIHDHHVRYSWDHLRRRRDFRKIYVSALAQKLAIDEATRVWSYSPPGGDEIQEKHEVLLKEVPAIDKRFWTSLARWEYRKIVVHLYVLLDTTSCFTAFPWSYLRDWVSAIVLVISVPSSSLGCDIPV